MVTILAPTNCRFLNRLKGTIGCSTRHSVKTNNIKATQLRIIKAKILKFNQPQSLPLTKTKVKLNRTIIDQKLPKKSILAAPSACRKSSKCQQQHSAIKIKGTLIKKMPRQPTTWTTTPPIVGPSAAASPCVTPNIAIVPVRLSKETF